MDNVEVMYWLPHCSTCQKADAFLKGLGVQVKSYVDVKTQRVDKATIAKLADAVGGPEALFSKRALKYRAMGLHERTVSPEEMLDLMHEEYTFIKRPVIVTTSGKVLSGFSEKQYKALFQ